MKQCKKCNQVKSSGDFYKLKRIDGAEWLRPYCKKCWVQYNKKYVYAWRKGRVK